MTTNQWFFLSAGTVFLAVFSWKFSIRAMRYHGVARFFAFESLLALGTLNAGPWFRDPGSPRQLVSWAFLLVSLYLAAHGLYLLVRLGKPRKDDLENTTQLVTRGLYGFIRHPLYASLIYVGIGACLKQVTPLTTALAAVNAAALFVTAKVEEGEMTAKFGEDYRIYMTKTKRFIPFLF